MAGSSYDCIVIGAGPGGTDMQSILALVNSQETEVLGITVLTGDDWRDEEVAHTLRLLEIIGRTEIPVLPGAVSDGRIGRPKNGGTPKNAKKFPDTAVADNNSGAD